MHYWKIYGSKCQDWNLNLTLTKYLYIAFKNLLNYDLHVKFQELRKNNFKISFIPKIIEKYISFIVKQSKKKKLINKKSIYILHFINGLIDNLVKNLEENSFLHLS